MRSAVGAVGMMLAIALALLVQATAAVWRSLPEIEDTARAAYHSVAGICRHTFVAKETEFMSVTALLVLAGATLVLVRFAHDAARRWWDTRSRVRLLLKQRTAAWSNEVTAAATRLGLTDHLDLVRHPAAFAFCYGYFLPRICVSSGLVDRVTCPELEAVLLHEDHHRRRRDPLLVLFTNALSHALFFIPILRDLQARYDAQKEFAADAAAVRRLGRVEPMAGALYKVLSCPVAGPDLDAAAVGGLSVTERRIDQLISPGQGNDPTIPRRRFLASSLAFASTSLPLIALTVANLQPIIHACRF